MTDTPIRTAYLGIKHRADNANRSTIDAISHALSEAGFETSCVVRDLESWGQHQFPAAELMKRTFAMIDQCDMAVIEMSEKGVGVGIEAGYAHARGIPVAVLVREGTDVSTTLQGIASATIEYSLDHLSAVATTLRTLVDVTSQLTRDQVAPWS